MLKAACPYCYQPAFDQVPPLDPNQQRSWEEINQLHDEIRKLDESVANLSRKRAALLRDLNTVQPSISTLPRETLSLIFFFACPPPKLEIYSGKSDFISVARPRDLRWYDIYTVLSDVCQLWRRTLLSTPQLWNCVNGNITDDTIDTDVSFFLQFFRNSGDLPLTLSFNYNYAESLDITGNLLHPNIDPDILRNFSRIKTLHLEGPPPAWFSHSPPYLSRLTHCLLDRIPSEREHNLTLKYSPHLTQLTLIDILTPIELPSPCHLTVLNLCYVPLDTCFYLLSNCPGLIELHARSMAVTIWDVDSGPLPVEKFTLNKMKVFDWSVSSTMGIDQRWQDALLNHIHLPSLRTLRWNHTLHSLIFAFEQVAENFFSNLPSTLTTLELDKIGGFQGDFTNVLNHLPDHTNIEHLILRNCSTTFVQGTLQTLIPRKDGNSRFPDLRKITIDGMRMLVADFRANQEELLHKAGKEISALLAEVLEPRTNGPGNVFTLYLTNMAGCSWLSKPVQWTIFELKGRGCRVEVLDGISP